MKAWTILLPLAVILLLLGSCCKVKPFQLFPTEDMYRILDPPPADRDYVACRANGQVCVYPPIFPGFPYPIAHEVKLRERLDSLEVSFYSRRFHKEINPSQFSFDVKLPLKNGIGKIFPLTRASWGSRRDHIEILRGGFISGSVSLLSFDREKNIMGRFEFKQEVLRDGKIDTMYITDGVFNFKLTPNK